MASDSTTVVDRTTVDPSTGKLALVIQVDSPWDEAGTAHRLIREKVKKYVRHIRTPEFQEEHGRAPTDTIIRVVSVEPPGDATVQFLERVRYELDKHGIGFDLEVDWTGEALSAENGRLEVRGWEVRPEGRGREGVKPTPRPEVQPESIEPEASESNAMESGVIEPEAIELDDGQEAEVDDQELVLAEPVDLEPVELPEVTLDEEPEALALDAAEPGEPTDVAQPEVGAAELEPAGTAPEEAEAGAETETETEMETEGGVLGLPDLADEPIEWPAEEFGEIGSVEEVPEGLQEEEGDGAAEADRADESEAGIGTVEDGADDDLWLELAAPQEPPPEASTRKRAAGRPKTGRAVNPAATPIGRPSLVKALGAAFTAAMAGSVIWGLLAAVSGNAASALALAASVMVGFNVRVKGSGHSFAFRLVGGLGTLLACALGSILSAGALVLLGEGQGFSGLIEGMAGLQPLLDTLGRYFGLSDLALYGAAVLLSGLISAKRKT